ncbi:hypothetical protein VKT23_008957 [Stygiomarasmius scandens]|uniref:Uncharacterized protein n=1 Tax=Marasmiellus scandens TaxID=2682957 RepID=A0ABR1JG18_9AGAR
MESDLLRALLSSNLSIHPETRSLMEWPPIAKSITDNTITPRYVLGWHLPSRSAFYRHFKIGAQWTDVDGYFDNELVKDWNPEWKRVRPQTLICGNGGRLIVLCTNRTEIPRDLLSNPKVIELAKSLLKLEVEPQWFRRDSPRFRGPIVLAKDPIHHQDKPYCCEACNVPRWQKRAES